MKTREEVERLKQEWESDPCWDIEETEGFAEHRQELLLFRLEREVAWELEQQEWEKKLDEEAERLGVRGLYRKLLRQEELLYRCYRAISLLTDGEKIAAYKSLIGYEED